MAEKTQDTVADLMTVWKATFFEVPLAEVRWRWGVGREQEVTEAAWKGYDAWVRLASASIDGMYRNSLFGEMVTRSLDGVLRWQRLSQALIGAVFAGLWPALGLPAAARVHALHEDLQPLAARLMAQDAQLYALRQELRSLIAGLPPQRKRRAPIAKPDAPLPSLNSSPIAVPLRPL